MNRMIGVLKRCEHSINTEVRLRVYIAFITHVCMVLFISVISFTQNVCRPLKTSHTKNAGMHYVCTPYTQDPMALCMILMPVSKSLLSQNWASVLFNMLPQCAASLIYSTHNSKEYSRIYYIFITMQRKYLRPAHAVMALINNKISYQNVELMIAAFRPLHP